MRDGDLGAVPWSDAPIYWAQGVLAEVLGIAVEEADGALRAHAEKTGRPLLEVAHDVVDLRFSSTRGTTRSPRPRLFRR